MLPSSRLAIFPTGKHWEWRAITFLSLMSGEPILMDKSMFEPYFPLNEFEIFYDENEWSNLEDIINLVSNDQWQLIRKHNQSLFDRYLSPIPVGNYICKTIFDWFKSRNTNYLQ
jgi:hypothetical protein